MSARHFIITGTSRGIGEQLAKQLLEKDGFVYGISRGDSSELAGHPKYRYYPFDLCKGFGIERLVATIFERIDLTSADRIVLVNNAAMLEPLSPIERCRAEEISRSIGISLVAPMI